MSLNAAQSRAARGWLGWTQAQLAERAQVGLSTLRDFESGSRTPIQNNVAAIRRALEEGGAGPFLHANDGLEPPESPAIQSQEAVPDKRSGSVLRGKRGSRSRRSSGTR